MTYYCFPETLRLCWNQGIILHAPYDFLCCYNIGRIHLFFVVVAVVALFLF